MSKGGEEGGGSRRSIWCWRRGCSVSRKEGLEEKVFSRVFFLGQVLKNYTMQKGRIVFQM